MLIETCDGCTIRLGKSQQENDMLLRSASPGDMWVHLSNYPSGHAIVENNHSPGKKPARHVMVRAAMLVRQHSKHSRNTRNAICDVARVGDVVLTHVPGSVHVKNKYSI